MHIKIVQIGPGAKVETRAHTHAQNSKLVSGKAARRDFSSDLTCGSSKTETVLLSE